MNIKVWIQPHGKPMVSSADLPYVEIKDVTSFSFGHTVQQEQPLPNPGLDVNQNKVYKIECKTWVDSGMLHIYRQVVEGVKSDLRLVELFPRGDWHRVSVDWSSPEAKGKELSTGEKKVEESSKPS